MAPSIKGPSGPALPTTETVNVPSRETSATSPTVAKPTDAFDTPSGPPSRSSSSGSSMDLSQPTSRATLASEASSREIPEPPMEILADVKTFETIPRSAMAKTATSAKAPDLLKNDGPLFDGIPSVHQARQGALGDCWLMATMAAIAHKRPQFIQDQVCKEVQTEDGKRAFEVTIFRSYDNAEQKIYVDDTLPHKNGKLRLGHPGKGQQAIWAAVIEKAVAANANPVKPQYKDIQKVSGIIGHKMLAGNTKAKSLRLFGQTGQDVHALLKRVVNHEEFPATVKRVRPNSGSQLHGEHEMVVDRYENKVLHLIDQRNGKTLEYTLKELCKGKKGGDEDGHQLTHLNWCEIPASVEID